MRMQRSVSSQPAGILPIRPSSWRKPPTSTQRLAPERHVGADQVADRLALAAASPSGCSRRPSRTRAGTSAGRSSTQRGRTAPPTPSTRWVGVGGAEPLDPVGRRRPRRRRGRRRPRRRSRRRRCCGRRRGPAARGWEDADVAASAAGTPLPARASGRSPARSRAAATVWVASDSTACRDAADALQRVGADRPPRSTGRRLLPCWCGWRGTGAGYSRPGRCGRWPTRTSRRSMRILMLAQSFSPVVGGEERIVEDLSAELVAPRPRGRRRDPAPAAGRAAAARGRGRGRAAGELGAPHPRRLGRRGAPLRAAGARPARRSADLRRLMRELQPDVVHAHNWLVHSYLPLDRRAGAAFVLSLHDYSLVCATKRSSTKAASAAARAARKCLGHCVRLLRRRQGRDGRRPAVASPSRGLRRRVDMFLPVSAAVRELSGMRAGRRASHRPQLRRRAAGRSCRRRTTRGSRRCPTSPSSSTSATSPRTRGSATWSRPTPGSRSRRRWS